jgi:fumarylacetoacetate (FAA) hydrolase family protein
VKDPTSLLPFRRAIKVELVLENPFVGDDVRANEVRDKIPGVVGDQGSKLFFHSAALD